METECERRPSKSVYCPENSSGLTETLQYTQAAGWQNQGYAWYIVPRTYSEKVGLIDWRSQFLDKKNIFLLNVVELVEK